MLTKAYENHYDWAILVAGDADFVSLVKAVKDTGKRVYGFYFDSNASQALKDCLDAGYAMDKLTTYIDILK